jgi:hypothetical protein
MITLALVASQIPLTEMRCADVSLRRLTASASEADWRRLTPKADGRGLTSFMSSLFNTEPATMETLAFLLLVTMQRNNTGVVSVSMEIFDYVYLVTTAFGQTRHNINMMLC